jgi:DNA replication protein DnaC
VERLIKSGIVKKQKAGSTGTGKTYLACAFGNMACRLGYTVKYLRLPRLLMDLNIAKTDGSYDRVLSQLKKFSLLILDDWGLAEISAADSRDILEVIEDRMSTGSTILAAQIPIANWFELFADPTLADTVLPLMGRQDLRGNFSSCKAEEESGLPPADDENAAGRKINRKDVYSLVGEQYDACLDRLVHNAYRIEIEGDSMRKILAARELTKDGT